MPDYACFDHAIQMLVSFASSVRLSPIRYWCTLCRDLRLYTNLSMGLIRRKHAGSLVLREFTEKRQSYPSLYVDIHETVDLSGQFVDRIERTTCVAMVILIF